jgi:hypothetical protein
LLCADLPDVDGCGLVEGLPAGCGGWMWPPAPVGGGCGPARGRRRGLLCQGHPSGVRRLCGGWLDTGCVPIALLAVPGVDLVVIVVLVAVMLARKRWVSDQPGAFRIVDGEVPGLGTRWMRGYGRWFREIVVWMKAPFCSGMSWWSQMLLRALLARPIRVR